MCAQPAGPTRAKTGLETHLNMPVGQIFDEIGKDENGTINHSELLQYLLGKGQEPETVSELFAILDTNDDGQISREELAAGTRARAAQALAHAMTFPQHDVGGTWPFSKQSTELRRPLAR